MKFKNVLTLGLMMAVLASPMVALAAPGNRTNIPNHPRVNQVNQRVQNQHQRIEQGVRSGKISQSEAKQLHQERGQIKSQERAMRKADGGHLTKQDQKTLNQELNNRSQEIKADKQQ